MEVKQKIRSFINQHLIVFDEEAVFSDEDNIFEKGFVNSLLAMKLLNFVEQEFSIELDNDEIDISNFNSVNNIERTVNRKLAEKVTYDA